MEHPPSPTQKREVFIFLEDNWIIWVYIAMTMNPAHKQKGQKFLFLNPMLNGSFFLTRNIYIIDMIYQEKQQQQQQHLPSTTHMSFHFGWNTTVACFHKHFFFTHTGYIYTSFHTDHNSTTPSNSTTTHHLKINIDTHNNIKPKITKQSSRSLSPIQNHLSTFFPQDLWNYYISIPVWNTALMFVWPLSTPHCSSLPAKFRYCNMMSTMWQKDTEEEPT